MARPDSGIKDVLIIGGSHAGLSAALTLYRALHTTVVFDDNKPRNENRTPVRLTPTWEGQSPDQLRAVCRQELLRAGLTTFVEAKAAKVEHVNDDGIFKVVDANGQQWLGRKVLLAMGAQDVYPDIPGYSALFTQGIYHCMFQFGYELLGTETAGLLAIGSLSNATHALLLAHDGLKYTNKMTIYTNGNGSLAEIISAKLKTPGISVDDRTVSLLSKSETGGVVLEFEDGTHAQEGFLVHRPGSRIDQDIPDQVGVKVSEQGFIEASPPFYKTNAPGIFAAGDCASMMHTISHSMTMGSYAGCAISRELEKTSNV